MSVTINQIASFLNINAKIINEEVATPLENAKPIQLASNKSLVWVAKDRNDKFELVKNTLSKVIVCDNEFLNISESFPDKCFIIVEDPRLAFIRIVNEFFAIKPEFGIHPSAIISPRAKIHPQVFIGPNTYIGECEIAEGCIIVGNNYLYDGVKLGENVIVNAGSIIGADGFGYQRNEINEFEKFPHIGGVIIEKNVEIGANTCIDRGTLDNTIVREGAKIDNFVHIAHNVIIGKHTAVIAHAMIGGSTKIGNYSWVAPSASLRDRLIIGDDVTIGLGAVVTKNIPDGQTWTGSPARELNEFINFQQKIKNIK